MAIQSRKKQGEHGVWQRCYWEHLIRDERDVYAHMEYIHITLVKHGLVNSVIDWPYSTFHGLVEQGVYGKDWVWSLMAGTLGYTD